MKTSLSGRLANYVGGADRNAALAGIVLVGAVVFGLAFSLDSLSLDAIFGVLAVVVLLIITLPVLTWIARKEGDRRWQRILLWAFVAKLVGIAVRYYVITIVYDDVGDAGTYAGAGQELARMYFRGQFTLHPPSLAGRGVETERIAVVVGIIFMFTGSSRYAASIIFGWLCFIGQILMWRAMRRAVPESDSRRYALLVFFLPSMLFWPSSIGKEALMVLSIGVACYGAAQILGARPNAIGIIIFLSGAGGLFFVRPHMSLMAIVSLAFASLVSSLAGFKREDASKAFFVRIAAIALLIVGGTVAMTQLTAVLGGGESGEGGLEKVLERTKGQTSTGGSEFAPTAVSSPVDLPSAIVTVLFRPFPWEARNVNGIIAASEGALLAGLCFAGRRRLLSWARTCLSRPYLVYSATFVPVFIVAFSYVGNFGILARQRTQMLPLALTLIGMPVAAFRRNPLFSFPGGRKHEIVDDDHADDLDDADHAADAAPEATTSVGGRGVAAIGASDP